MNKDNIFFDIDNIKSIGRNVIIGKTVRIRYPELVEIGDNVIIDDFTYISTKLTIDNNVHISSGCKIIGGKNSFVKMGEFSTLAPNVVLSAGSDDYISGLATPMVPMAYKANAVVGEINIGKHCIVGAGSVILPNILLGEGSSVGALSLVNKNTEAWSLNVGIPSKKIKMRNKDEILCLEKKFRENNDG